MPTAKVTKNVSAAIGGGNVLCSTLISIKTKAWLYSFGRQRSERKPVQIPPQATIGYIPPKYVEDVYKRQQQMCEVVDKITLKRKEA